MQPPSLKEFVLNALSIAVLDLQYTNDLPATYGLVPIRHALLWENCERILGTEVFRCEVGRLMGAAASGNHPVKTNPQLH
jgi:hypothetical protein